MKLRHVQIGEYKSIRRPCQYEVGEITCLVGKNEAGKTALLEALYRLNPLVPEHGAFNVDDDYPRIDVEDYRLEVLEGRREPAVVTRARFLLEEEDLRELQEDFPGIQVKPELVLAKGYANELYAELFIDEQSAVDGLLKKAEVGAAQLKALAKQATLHDLAEALKGLSADKGLAPLAGLVARVQEQGLLDYLYRKYLEPRVPRFLYFSEFYQLAGQVNLQALARRRQEGRLLESDYPLLGLIELARLNLEDIGNPERALERDNRLEGASNHLTKRLMKYWTQNRHLELRFDIRPGLPKDPEGLREGLNLWVHVYNSRQKVRTLLGRRSRGFIWFFSFLAWFSQQKQKNLPLILLLDEPSLFLHGTAQRDLLRFLEDESRSGQQVLYTTQSPYLVDAARLERVRIVEDLGAEAEEQALAAGAGTQVRTELSAGDGESIAALQGALGQRLRDGLFPPGCHLVVEGVADLLFLQTMSSLLASAGRTGLDGRWAITPIGGARNLPAFAALLNGSAGGCLAALLPDEEEAGEGDPSRRELLRQARQFSFSEFTRSSQAAIEDMFEVDFYLELLNAEYRGSLAKPLHKAQLRGGGAGLSGMVRQALEALPAASPVAFDRCRVARYFARSSAALKEELSRQTYDRFENAFRTLNGLL